MQIIEILENNQLWIPEIREMSEYRLSLYSQLIFDRYVKQTPKGHIVSFKQYRKDFYKPSNFKLVEEGLFALNQVIRRERFKIEMERHDSHLGKVYRSLLEILERHYVWAVYPIKTLLCLNWLDEENYQIEKKYFGEDYTAPGHIRTFKHETPQYPGQVPLITDSNEKFYYRTAYRIDYKPDYDYRTATQVDLEDTKIISKAADLVLNNGQFDYATDFPEGVVIENDM